MSTRCHIFIEDQDDNLSLILYRHSDGYPQFPGVVPDLAEFLPIFNKVRGHWDPEYLAAQLLHFMIAKSSAHMLEVWEEICKDEDEKPGKYIQQILDNGGNSFTGHGICAEVHWDIEYAYVITKGRVDVYEVVKPADRSTWIRLTTDRQSKRIMEGKVPRKWKESKKKVA